MEREHILGAMSIGVFWENYGTGVLMENGIRMDERLAIVLDRHGITGE
jgi:hypothetical protein